MQQRVDPFIPVRGQAAASYLRRPVVAPRARSTRTHQARAYEKTIDGFIKSSPLRMAQQLAPEVAEQVSPWKQSVEPAAAIQALKTAAIAQPKRHTVKRTLHAAQMPAILAGAVGVGLLAPSLAVGEAAIGAYGLFAVTRGVASRTTFLLALVALGVIIAALGLQGSDSSIGQNFAVYAFLLLAVGTVSLGIEARREYA